MSEQCQDNALAIFLVGVGHFAEGGNFFGQGEVDCILGNPTLHPFVWLLPLPHHEERNTLNLRKDWDYPALRAMIAQFVVHRSQMPGRVSPSKISLWGVSCGGLAVWEAALQDGQSYQGLVTMSADVPDIYKPRKFLRSSCLASITATAVVCLCVQGSYEVRGLQDLFVCWGAAVEDKRNASALCSPTPTIPTRFFSRTTLSL